MQLTSEFRRLPKGHKRREDLLQLKSILWETWKSSPLFKQGNVFSAEYEDKEM
jgi:hypothetical protein